MAAYHYDPLIGSDAISMSTIGIVQENPSSKLHDYLLEYFKLAGSSCPMTSSLKTKALKGVLTCLGILGKTPLVAIALSYKSEYPALGITASIVNSIAYTSTSIWTSFKMVDQAVIALSTSEPHVSKTFDRARKIGVLAFNVLNAAIGQIPTLYLAWQYNNDKPFMLAFNALDVASPIYSLNMMTGPTLLNMAFSRNQKHIVSLKKEIIEKLDRLLKAMTQNDCSELIDAFRQIDSFQYPDIKMTRFFETILSEHIVEDQSDNLCLHDCKQSMSKMMGFMLLSVQLFWSAFLTYEGIGRLTSDTTLIGVMCLYVVIIQLALTRFVLIRSSFQLINSVTLKCKTPKASHYVCDRLSPVASGITKVFALVISAGGFIQAAKLSEDYLPKAFVFPSTLTFGLGLSMMSYLPLRDLSHTLLTNLVARYGSEQQKLHLFVYDKLSKIKRLFENSSIDSFAIFLLKHQFDSHLSAMMHKHNIRSDTLLSFLQESHMNRYENTMLYDDIYGDGAQMLY